MAKLQIFFVRQMISASFFASASGLEKTCATASQYAVCLRNCLIIINVP